MQTKTDAELLKAYVDTNDESAFTEFVSRHGPLVNRHDAEDASQAVFMALI